MAISKERLIEQRDKLQQDFYVVRSTLDDTTGAIQILDKLIAEDEAPEIGDVVKPT